MSQWLDPPGASEEKGGYLADEGDGAPTVSRGVHIRLPQPPASAGVRRRLTAPSAGGRIHVLFGIERIGSGS